MSVEYEVRLANPQGDEVAVLGQYGDVEIAWKESDEGMLTLSLPTMLLDGQNLTRDWRIQLWRAADGDQPRLLANTVWFVRQAIRSVSGGQRTTRITALSAVTLLRRRIIAYASGTAYTEKEAAADDVMKAFVRENLGALATDTDRRWSSYISVAPDRGHGATVRVEAARRGLLETLQTIAKQSREAGTYLAFDLTYDPATRLFLFETYTGQRGQDHRFPAGPAGAVLISEALLEDVEIDDDWTDEATYIYAVGKGSGSARPVRTANNAARIGESPFGRIEKVHNASQIGQPTALQDEADGAIQAAISRTRFKAKFSDSSELRFGLDFGLGDIVTAQADGESFDCRIVAAGLRVSGAAEAVDIRLEAE